ncbi:hypothetical protein QQS21_006420 [Conoideocrella luteorostrata]|uniref:Bacteriophage T5 Orf172 DNA-binding domain-containing protein n=1 Tax=Conoideocrella luteorostrata TaxID=1105319 RepID=A0AAJ0G073_9HYPO|nr:hypothetical protein QQS21_006420 [Conoideocrella luteorostrata]
MSQAYPTPPGSPNASDITVAQKKRVGPHADETSRCCSMPAFASTAQDLPLKSSSTKFGEQGAEKSPAVDIAGLRALLCLDNWRCGSTTKQGTPCKLLTAKQIRPQVDSHFLLVARLTQSSPESTGELETLARLVHCRLHKTDGHIEARIKIWNACLPSGEQINPAIALETEVRGILGPPTTKCLGETITQRNCSVDSIAQESCSVEIGGRRVQNCARTVDKIAELVTPRFEAKLEIEYFLKVLERNRYCENHSNFPLEHTSAWSLRIHEIRRKYCQEPAKSANDGNPKSSQSQEDDVDTKNDPTSTDTDSTTEHSSQRSRVTMGTSTDSPAWLNTDPADYWPREYDVTPFDKVKRRHNAGVAQNSLQKISSTVQRNLNEKAGDCKDGYIYLYQVEGNADYVKIGYTTRTLDLRHKEWEFECNRVPKMLQPGKSLPKRVPNVRRVEALCHAELDYCRVDIFCRGCLKEHTEWFEIPAANAIRVIQKWSDWMSSDPYEKKRTLRSGPNWALKVEEQQKVVKISDFMRGISTV